MVRCVIRQVVTCGDKWMALSYYSVEVLYKEQQFRGHHQKLGVQLPALICSRDEPSLGVLDVISDIRVIDYAACKERKACMVDLSSVFGMHVGEYINLHIDPMFAVRYAD